MTTRADVAAQMIIRRYIQPYDYITRCDGPDQFPRQQTIHTPLSWHRLRVYQHALGIVEYDEDAAYPGLRLTADDEARVRQQCAFIREHTTPLKPWPIPDGPFKIDSWGSGDELA